MSMSDRYREYARTVAETVLRETGTRKYDDPWLDELLDSIPAPAPIDGKAWAEKVRDHVVDTWVEPELRVAAKSLDVESLAPAPPQAESYEMSCAQYGRLVAMEAYNQLVPEISRRGAGVDAALRAIASILKAVPLVKKSPPGTTTPDVQAQVDAKQASPWWTMDDAAKARAQWQVGESEENWRARVLDAAVAAEREACAKLAEAQVSVPSDEGESLSPNWDDACGHIADEIRARSAQEKGESDGR